jgi:hypothetical protein
MTRFGRFQRALLHFTVMISFLAPVGAHAEILWAAAAISTDGAGWVWNYSSRDAALAAAKARCGGVCESGKVYNFAFSKGCAAIYRHTDPSSTGYGTDGGDTSSQAQSNAMNSCNRKYANCQLHTTICQSN